MLKVVFEPMAVNMEVDNALAEVAFGAILDGLGIKYEYIKGSSNGQQVTARIIDPKSGECYADVSWCDHCKHNTLQVFYCDGHERDSSNSSNDTRTCAECNWRYSGLTGGWSAPNNEEQ